MCIITRLAHWKVNSRRMRLLFQPSHARNRAALHQSQSIIIQQDTSRMCKGSIPHSSATAFSKVLKALFSGSPSHQSTCCSIDTNNELSLSDSLNFWKIVDLS